MSVLDELIAGGGRRPRFDRADPARLAGGRRGSGQGSDFDLIRVVTDESYAAAP